MPRMGILFLVITLFPLSSFGDGVVYTNDGLGELEPCGCNRNPAGGMVRRARLIAQLKSKQDLLQLDSGNHFFGGTYVPGHLREQSKIQARKIVESLNLIGLDAYTPGDMDFALGAEFLEELRKEAKFEFLAANLYSAGGDRLFESYKIFTRKDQNGKPIRIAVVGWVGAKLRWPKDLVVKSDPAILKETLKDVSKEKVDQIILLSHQGFEADKNFANQNTEFDAIIGGNSQSFIQVPQKHNETWIFQASSRHQHIGYFPIRKPFTANGFDLVHLDESWEPNEKQLMNQSMIAKSVKIVDEWKVAIANLNEKEENEAKRAIASTSDSKFQTFPACAKCHAPQFEFWRKTDHANALNSLIKPKQVKNKECLSCHVLGLGKTNGMTNINEVIQLKLAGKKHWLDSVQSDLLMNKLHKAKSLREEIKVPKVDHPQISLEKTVASMSLSWAAVQCESCHGASDNHPFFNPSEFKAKVSTETCLKCHIPARSTGWYDKNGKPNLELIKSKFAAIVCPPMAEAKD